MHALVAPDMGSVMQLLQALYHSFEALVVGPEDEQIYY
jgi:hypothetical protein